MSRTGRMWVEKEKKNKGALLPLVLYRRFPPRKTKQNEHYMHPKKLTLVLPGAVHHHHRENLSL
jgi:hypothetical protein